MPLRPTLIAVVCAFILLTPLQYALAQEVTITVSGKVLAAVDNESIIGANVVQKGTNNGTITDADGSFTLSVPSDATLVFSYIGYQTQEVELEGRKVVDIFLEVDAQLLDEVVVTGYRKETRSTVSSAIGTIKAERINKLPVLGFEQALQGQVSGVQITQATGAPGDDIAVRIRGVGTLGNNNPLYIIDGVPITGNINMLSITDIETIDVLKDGAAAAIYGARSANGVVVITTKKGKAGKPQISVQSYYGFQEANRLPDLLNAEEYLTIRNEAITNANTLRDSIRRIPTYDPAILDTLPDIDWLDEVFRIAPIQKHVLSASGGGETGSYYIAGEYFNQGGVFKGQGFEKYLLRFNGEVGTSKFKIGNNLSFMYSDRSVIGSSGDGAGPGNELSGIRYALIAAPVFPMRDASGELIPTSSLLGDPILYGDGNANPVAFINATHWDIQRYRLLGNVFVEIFPVKDLRLKTNLGADLLFGREKIFKERLSAAIYDPTSLSEGTVTDRTLIWSNTIDYTRSFGATSAHQFNLLLGMEAIENRTDYLGASARNFFSTNPNFRYIDVGINAELGDIDASGVATEWGLLSYFGQFGYNYKSRYIFNAAVRRDGSSRFGDENKYGTFPSVSVAWNVSNEPFFENVSLISNLKLRASWGQLGNQEIGIYPFSSLVETGRFVYPFGDQIVTGAQVLETGNDNIKWETTTQSNLGLELGFLKDRISFVADVYKKKSTDILVRVPLPQSAGAFNPPYVNAAEVENKGLELALSLRKFAGNFNYTLTANFSTVQNEVLSLAQSEPIVGGFGLSEGPITKTEPGYPIGSFFLYQMEGIFQTQEEIEASPFQSDDTRPGDVKFTDLNGDHVINDSDRAHLGSPFPDFIYGVSASFNFGNFDLSMLIQGVQGNDVYFLYGNFAYEVQSRGFNSYRDILDRWTPNNPNGSIPKVSIDDRNDNRRISTRFLEDGSYLRLKNISLGYDFAKMLNRPFIPSLRAYVSVQNAITITDYSGLDPEIQANTNDTQGFNISSDFAVGIDWGTVPAPRTVVFGINANF
ncbi:MAG TPA: TonB-dependent receptor [Saprospiraceae bacterium]|nr:TonB-dependent receptor [Saprospiraceae bacterium]